jgi:segregation and condensation protein A
MEDSREYMLGMVERERTLSFEKIFDICENRLHAIFTFLSMLELVQAKYFNILIGEGRNNFIVEWNEGRSEEEELSFAEGGEEKGQPEFRFDEGGDQPDEGLDESGEGDASGGDLGGGSGFFDDDDRALLN